MNNKNILKCSFTLIVSKQQCHWENSQSFQMSKHARASSTSSTCRELPVRGGAQTRLVGILKEKRRGKLRSSDSQTSAFQPKYEASLGFLCPLVLSKQVRSVSNSLVSNYHTEKKGVSCAKGLNQMQTSKDSVSTSDLKLSQQTKSCSFQDEKGKDT